RVTTVEPGANDVFTKSGTVNPFSTAFFASRPAPNITYGLDVFVQEVIAAIATAPVFITDFSPVVGFVISTSLSNSDLSKPKPWFPAGAVTAVTNFSCISPNAIRSCGRFGPARLDSNSDKLISTVSVYSGSFISAEDQKLFSLQYFSTNAICSSGRPVKRK